MKHRRRPRRLRPLGLAAAIILVITTPLGVVAAVSVQAAVGCQVTYRVTSQWAGGFSASIGIRNLGDAIRGWKLGWTFTAGQAVTQAWGFTANPTSGSVVAADAGNNAAIATDGVVDVGFNGSWDNMSNPVPSAFTLNGTACTDATTPSPSSTGGTAPSSSPSAGASRSPRPSTSPSPSSTPGVSTAPGASAPSGPGGRTWSNKADGFASLNANGVNGTTGGAAGPTVTVTTYADLLRYATASTPYVIRINAKITVPTYGYEIRVTSNKTLIGVGRNGAILHGGIFLGAGVRNVIIRNLTIGETDVASDDPDDKDFDYDGIQMDTADHIWIDHNLITKVNDGAIDSRRDTSYLTVSWNVLPGHNKAFGIGWTENVTARMTIHHNWIKDTNQRNPSTDNVAYAHLYNNYLQNVASYGNYARGGTKMVLENSYFENVKNPYYPDATAQLRQSGSITVNCTGRKETSGSAFTPSSFYKYTLDPASKVPALVRQYAGPQANIGQ
ncbi:hypothetical protein E1193_06440 [Micromonospora sp. KC606]|uniref:cellulose binding domain-containing protein n=1 Tax=Micromonospora sp. KC606 TaxID=2530379 RepID=UPI001045D503|nr:cellulose binding domain-containing protein [Micromonospora sp. KC606]TDC84209.1 hypothetical protein E1193_06440 [Micromonospora sp. KC606]